MKTIKLSLLLIAAVVLMSASTQQLEFNKPIVLTFKKLDGWSKWFSPSTTKIWKVENVWSSLHANSPDYFIQVNDAKTRHLYNEEISAFWLSEKDSIRIQKNNGEFDFAISILEYNSEE